MFRFPGSRLRTSGRKPQSGNRIQLGVQTPGFQAMPPNIRPEGAEENAADGVANPVRLKIAAFRLLQLSAFDDSTELAEV